MRIAVIDTSTSRATIIVEGLREAGLTDVTLIDPQSPLLSQLEQARPEVVLVNLENPSRDLLEDYFAVSRALARPIAMFVDQSDDQMIAAAIDAGVSAYVVDGLRKDRVKPILDLAIRRFNAFANLQKELAEARTALAERRIIDKAKLYLMSTRKLAEADAYALLRGTAMRQGKRIADIAQALLTAAELLEGKQKDESPN